MDPVSKEYFYTIEFVKGELESFKLQQNELKNQIYKLYHENKRLVNELKEAVILRDRELSEKGFHDLETKLVSANKAKETALELWQEAMRELEKKEELLVGRKSLVETERNDVVKSLEEIKNQYQKGVTTLTSELSSCRTELSSTRQELQGKVSQLRQCSSELVTVKEELSCSRKSLAEVSLQKTELSHEISSLKNSIVEKENLISVTKVELDANISKNLELSSLVKDLKEQNEKLKHDVAAIQKDAKESLFAAQEAILQKKEMALREEQLLKEIKDLKSSSGMGAQKIELKCNAMIKELQEQHSAKVQSLMEEIQLLHKENGEKQCLFEKVEREKKALESKLELLYSETAGHYPRGTTIFEDLAKRLTIAEQARDEFALKIKTLQIDLEEIKSNRDQEVKCLANEKSTLKEKLSLLSNECNQYVSDKIKQREECVGLRKKCYELEKEIKLSKSKQAQALASFHKESSQKQQTLEDQLLLVEEHYKGMCGELQSLLESQFKLGSRWKEETEELLSKSESKILELCNTIAHLQQQNNELVSMMEHNDSYKRIINFHDRI